MDKKQFAAKMDIIHKHRAILDALVRDIEAEYAESQNPEPLEKFEMCACKFTLRDGCINMEVARGLSMVYFGDGNYAELIQNLQCMAATAEREQNGPQAT